jgi:hypothetical protein
LIATTFEESMPRAVFGAMGTGSPDHAVRKSLFWASAMRVVLTIRTEEVP